MDDVKRNSTHLVCLFQSSSRCELSFVLMHSGYCFQRVCLIVRLSVCLSVCLCVCLSTNQKVLLETSCSVDQHVSGCKYFNRCVYVKFVCFAESAKSRCHGIVAAVGDADVKLGRRVCSWEHVHVKSSTLSVRAPPAVTLSQ